MSEDTAWTYGRILWEKPVDTLSDLHPFNTLTSPMLASHPLPNLHTSPEYREQYVSGQCQLRHSWDHRGLRNLHRFSTPHRRTLSNSSFIWLMDSGLKDNERLRQAGTPGSWGIINKIDRTQRGGIMLPCSWCRTTWQPWWLRWSWTKQRRRSRLWLLSRPCWIRRKRHSRRRLNNRRPSRSRDKHRCRKTSIGRTTGESSWRPSARRRQETKKNAGRQRRQPERLSSRPKQMQKPREKAESHPSATAYVGKSDLTEYLDLLEMTVAKKEMPILDWPNSLMSLLNDKFRGVAIKMKPEERMDHNLLKQRLQGNDNQMSEMLHPPSGHWQRVEDGWLRTMLIKSSA